MAVNESTLTKGLLRKLNALRKSIGHALADETFSKWLKNQPEKTVSRVDKNVERIVEALNPLVTSGKVRIPRGGYILRRGRGRVIIERGKKGKGARVVPQTRKPRKRVS